jgi:hypothetical protein
MTYYTRAFNPQPTQRVSSSDLKNEFQAIEGAFSSAEDDVGKSLRAPESLSALPNAASRALKVLSFDASGNPDVPIAVADLSAAVTAAANAAASEAGAAAQVVLASDQVALAAAQVVLASDEVALAAGQVSIATAQAGIATTKAAEAAASAASIADGPVASVNGMTGIVTGLASQADLDAITITSQVLSTPGETVNAAVGVRYTFAANNITLNAPSTTNKGDYHGIRAVIGVTGCTWVWGSIKVRGATPGTLNVDIQREDLFYEDATRGYI